MTNPSAWLQRALSPFREFGLLAGALYVGDRLLRAVSRRSGIYFYEFMAQPIADKALLPSGLARNLEYREILRGDPLVEAMPARAEVKESRYDQGAVCLGAFRRGELIGYIWFCFQEYAEDEIHANYVLPRGDRAVFDFDLYILPEHRMGIAFVAIWDGASKYLRARGIDVTYSRLTRFNSASRRSHAHLHWRCVGKACIFSLAGLEIMMCSLRPFISIAGSRGQRRKIHFPAVTFDRLKALGQGESS